MGLGPSCGGGREEGGERLRPGSQRRAGPQTGILAKLQGPLPGGPTRHRQEEQGLETPWETLRAGSFEDDPAGNRRKRKDQPSWGLEAKGRESDAVQGNSEGGKPTL